MKTCCGDLGIPPPCPVDDTPFTACTAETVAASQSITQPLGAAGPTTVVVPVVPPFLMAGRPAAPNAARTEEPVSTKTYRGTKRGALRDGRPRLTK